MVAQMFQMLAKLGFCSNCSQNFSGCSFARARIYLQVLACSVFSEGSFCKVLVAARLTFINACARKEKRCAQMLARTIRYPYICSFSPVLLFYYRDIFVFFTALIFLLFV